MKQLNYFLVLAALTLLLGACERFSNRGTVDMPYIAAANTSTLSIESVTLTDSTTVLNAVNHFRPGWWFIIADSSCIVADGKKYPMISIEGIESGKRVTMPDSGIIHFTMTFPAIPADVKTIDYDENVPDGFVIWGIDLTGKADHTLNLAEMPASVRNIKTPQTLDVPEFKYDTATVNIHLMGYRPGMDGIFYAINTLHGQMTSDKTLNTDSLGNIQLKFALSAPAWLYVRGGDQMRYSGDAVITPGENIDMYIDTHLSGLMNMSQRSGIENGKTPEGFNVSYNNGKYSFIRWDNIRNLFTDDDDFADYHMTGDEYTDALMAVYNARKDSLEAADINPAIKEYVMAAMQVELAGNSAYYMNEMANDYREKNGWDAPIYVDSIKTKLSADNYRRIADAIDFNNPYIYLTEDASNIPVKQFRLNGIDAGIFEKINTYQELYDLADKGEYSASNTDLTGLPEAFVDELEAHNAYMQQRLANLDWSAVTPAPEVPADKLIAEIIKPYKGKVVMVDLWNTWCGPCRRALAANEPEKSGDLASDDIVWIYIADESSPVTTYFNMIKDIKGIHYRLTEDQINKIRNQFDVDGIPYYILVDITGKATGRPDIRDHRKFKRTILDELKK